MTRTLLAALAASALASAAHADGVAEISTPSQPGSETATIAWQDADTLRIDTPDPAGYMLIRDGNAYAVTDQPGMGLMVLDLASIMTMARGMAAAGGMDTPSLDEHRAAAVERITATGTRETVAGLEGEVYEIVWTDAAGDSHTDTAVLSGDALAREFTAAFAAFAQASGTEPDARSVELHDRGLGILRYGDDFALVSISGDAPGADHFELPAEPMTMQDMMRGRMPD
ncbi:hypothetical protein E5163_14635 [Marinicauda algicola]|uniref:DUF4412 domain-containing protein n=1 Tax=Marinicauda algicola TaxID=2029849 RepID=A0A4S2GX73_9PROT|nr:hypothetical protein [Marinicauda algicola]TGY87666.1 hypothetical protein E5163_14635 [Marinicauda algicola]